MGINKSSVQNRLSVVLVSSRNPLNIGAAARAMSNFGFQQLRLVNPYKLAFREARSAKGASAVLENAAEYRNVSDAVADCSLIIGTTAARNRQIDHPLILLPTSKVRIGRHAGKIALLFGSEKRGLSNQDLSYCHWLMRIPTIEGSPSMNLGQAVAVCLYELTRNSDTRPRSNTSKASTSSAELDRLTSVLLDALLSSGYLKANIPAAAEEKLHRLVRRLNLSEEDAHTLLGMLRQMLWKMRSKE